MSQVVCFGEAMVRLAPPHSERIEQARTFDVEVGGAELNTAVGLVRLGREVSWVSALPENPLGRLVANRVREAGVDASKIQFDEYGRCGLYFVEFGAAPRASAIQYDRKDSTLSHAKPGTNSFWGGKKAGTFDWAEIFDGSKWFHSSGITAAILDDREVLNEALQQAKTSKLGISFDLNYRSKLWPADEAGRALAPLLKSIDLLIASEGDAEQLFGIRGENFEEVAQKLVDRFDIRYVAAVRRDANLVLRDRFGGIGFRDGEVIETPRYEVEVIDRLGTGDAFASGIIDGLLHGDFERGLQTAAALGALKHTVPGDLPWIDKDEVDAVLAGQGLKIRR